MHIIERLRKKEQALTTELCEGCQARIDEAAQIRQAREVLERELGPERLAKMNGHVRAALGRNGVEGRPEAIAKALAGFPKGTSVITLEQQLIPLNMDLGVTPKKTIAVNLKNLVDAGKAKKRGMGKEAVYIPTPAFIKEMKGTEHRA